MTPGNRSYGLRLKKGDRVSVSDPALAQLRAIMRQATGKEPKPNHIGTIEDPDFAPGEVLIYFDDGSGAPYPIDQCTVLKGNEK